YRYGQRDHAAVPLLAADASDSPAPAGLEDPRADPRPGRRPRPLDAAPVAPSRAEAPPARPARVRPRHGPLDAAQPAGPGSRPGVSAPRLDWKPRGPLAQLVEQGTLNPKVEGSNPSRPTHETPAKQRHTRRGTCSPSPSGNRL